MKPDVNNTLKNALVEQQMVDAITQIRQTPHNWQVGDLIEHPREKCSLLINSDSDNTRSYLVFLSKAGKVYELTRQEASRMIWYNTGLVYTYQNQEEVQKDYRKGLFEPYFTQ